MMHEIQTLCKMKPVGFQLTGCEDDDMTYGQFLAQVYRENKRYIRFSIALCMVLSMIFFGRLTAVNAIDIDGSTVVAGAGGSFGQMLAPVVSTGFLNGIDISWVMIIMCASALGAASGVGDGVPVISKLSGFSFGIFENKYVSIALLVWFGVPIILKAFSKTNAIGTSIESAQKKVNGILMVIILISQMIMSADTVSKVHAAGAIVNTVRFGVSALACFVILIVAMIVYLLVHYLFSLIDIIMVPVCTVVPFVSFLFVLGKLALVWIFILFAIYIPWFFFVIAGVIVIVSAFLFRTAYMAARYFENVYVKALFKKVFGGYDANIPILTQKKVPSKVTAFLADKNVQMVIPVYVVRPIPNVKGMRKFDRFWMVSEQGATYLIKPLLGKKDVLQVPLYNNPAQKMFINPFLTYYEIFNIYGSEEAIVKTFKRVPKMCHIVFSKEYFHRYQEIGYLTGFVDYRQYKEYLNSLTRQPYPPMQ